MAIARHLEQYADAWAELTGDDPQQAPSASVKDPVGPHLMTRRGLYEAELAARPAHTGHQLLCAP